MGKISTHILLAAAGQPAAGVAVQLWHLSEGGSWVQVSEALSNADGRCDAPLRSGTPMPCGIYELRFAIGTFFSARGQESFYQDVPVRFSVTDGSANYHVPLLISPFSYTTYRGS
ncbi:hydroxyisourate hydrolase [Polycladidibacter hongkongensis]|uniref:hydroxyisourate hydrolase n=1 Tax=Polycladidibacter hongkongensis TaxID=1647556 RepID=UPI00082F904C|nr:hydroxyisourate hydrolase [Pseudovibrio hongkongensis]